MTPWTLQSMEFSRPEYWSGQPFPSPGDLPNPGIEPRSPALQVDYKQKQIIPTSTKQGMCCPGESEALARSKGWEGTGRPAGQRWGTGGQCPGGRGGQMPWPSPPSSSVI